MKATLFRLLKSIWKNIPTTIQAVVRRKVNTLNTLINYQQQTNRQLTISLEPINMDLLEEYRSTIESLVNTMKDLHQRIKVIEESKNS
jgi:hypothetical protein